MKWFKKRTNPKPNEHAGLLFSTGGLPIEAENLMLFPKLDQVFVKPNSLHKIALFPLCSINLKALDPDWDFFAHFFYIYRTPEEAHSSKKYYSQHCTTSSLGFDYTDGKYELQAKDKLLEVSEVDLKYQKKTKEKYQRFVKDYQANGFENLLPINENFNYLIKQFGKEPLWVEEDATPKDIRGNDMLFIGQVRVLDFIGEHQYVYLFYSPEEHYFVQCEQYH